MRNVEIIKDQTPDAVTPQLQSHFDEGKDCVATKGDEGERMSLSETLSRNQGPPTEITRERDHPARLSGYL